MADPTALIQVSLIWALIQVTLNWGQRSVTHCKPFQFIFQTNLPIVCSCAVGQLTKFPLSELSCGLAMVAELLVSYVSGMVVSKDRLCHFAKKDDD